MPVLNDNQNIVPEARPKYGATELLGIPNMPFTSQATRGLSVDFLYYSPFIVKTPITVTALTIEVTTPQAGRAVRVGIYRADKDWQPTSLAGNPGTLSVNAVAVVSLAGLSIALQEGRYLTALHSESNPALREVRGGTPFLNPILSATPILYWLLCSTVAYGVLADPGIAWDTAIYSTVGISHLVFLTWTP